MSLAATHIAGVADEPGGIDTVTERLNRRLTLSHWTRGSVRLSVLRSSRSSVTPPPHRTAPLLSVTWMNALTSSTISVPLVAAFGSGGSQPPQTVWSVPSKLVSTAGATAGRCAPATNPGRRPTVGLRGRELASSVDGTVAAGRDAPGRLTTSLKLTTDALALPVPPPRCAGAAPTGALGSTRAGVLKTTIAEETETDLFGEQAVLCGGITSLIRAGFETLVDAGYQPEVAYFECMHEMKLIVDLMYQGGMSYMRYSISDTAEYGDYVSGPRIIDERARDEMRKILREIQDGTFATRWILENQAGRPSFQAMRRSNAQHQIEQVGSELRSMMPWLNAGNKKQEIAEKKS